MNQGERYPLSKIWKTLTKFRSLIGPRPQPPFQKSMMEIFVTDSGRESLRTRNCIILVVIFLIFVYPVIVVFHDLLCGFILITQP